jgi:uncharacterized OsmC-like protein
VYLRIAHPKNQAREFQTGCIGRLTLVWPDKPDWRDIMSTLQLEYDGDQHATALREPYHNTLAIDCPFTAKGDEFSPGNLLGISVAGCMLLSMGAVAQRDQLDLTGTVVNIELTETDKPYSHVDTITLAFNIPRDFAFTDRLRMQRAAELCPIKHSFGEDTVVTATYNYAAAIAA